MKKRKNTDIKKNLADRTSYNSKMKHPLYKTIQYIFHKAWNGHRSVLWCCIAAALLAVTENLIGLFIAPVILGKVEQAVLLSDLLWTILGFAAALMACQALTAYLNTNSSFEQISTRIDILSDIHQKSAETSYPNIGNPAFLELQNKAKATTRSNYSAAERIWTVLSELLKNLLGFAVYLILLSNLNPVLLAVTLTTAIAGHFISKRFNEWGYRHRDEEKDCMNHFFYIDQKCTDTALAKDIRIFRMVNWLSPVYHNSIRKWRQFHEKAETVYFCADAIDAALSLLRNGISYGFLIAMTLRQGLSASQFLLYFTAITGFTSWISGILGQFTELHKQGLELSNVLEYLDAPELFQFEDGEPLVADPNGSYELRLDHVSFRYPGADRDIIHDMSLTVKAGEKLAIVGNNGAGKTTLIKLMSGFLDPTEGAVLLNGVDIRRYNRRDYYKHFAAVFQQFSVLASSIAENVAQQENFDRDRVEDCLKQAGLLEKVNELGGIDVHMGREVYEDGVIFSGGETQRLMLARALYKNAPLIFLDEPTAALDPIAEDHLYHQYSDLTKGRTSVYISHRLASTRFCDRIILLENGETVEEGTHDSLLAAGGRYAEIFEVQRQYYQEGVAENV